MSTTVGEERAGPMGLVQGGRGEEWRRNGTETVGGGGVVEKKFPVLNQTFTSQQIQPTGNAPGSALVTFMATRGQGFPRPDYQPLFEKGARVPPPPFPRGGRRTGCERAA